MTIKKNCALFALISLLAGCYSLPQSATKLPEKPKPQVPADLMVPLPEPLHFQKTLKEDFGSVAKKPTE
ncbi:hypothetical protein DBR37_01535 [Herminiimonas sp. KBW02]|nr:hypothetical protein DBR37_01535 [Herminiimonas sp. KBW02]